MADCSSGSGGVAAVEIRNCSKSYDTFKWRRQKGCSKTKPVLDNLNVNVPQGSIYALLGPSGCGKTTLMKCILGRLKVNNGTITMFGKQIGLHNQVVGPDIGYMPQETSMFALLTIEETLQYYGQILGMSKNLIKCQTNFLVEFLKLPPKETLNGKLSGGQLRRLSFAVATVHKPKLIILDEPTVGVDPIGRQRMWCYLKYIVSNCSSTIILSTHYIEEARTVDIVGLMQDGAMLAEESPDFLLRTWNVSTLEELFFKVYSKHLENNLNSNIQESNLNNASCSDTQKPFNDIDQTKDDYKSDLLSQQINQKLNEFELSNDSGSKTNTFLKMSQIAAIIKKKVISLSRNISTLIFLLLLPPASIAIIMIVISGDIYNLTVGVCNEDLGTYGKMYLDLLNTDLVQQVEYASYGEGHQAVVDGKNFGFISIPNNFSDTFVERFINMNLVTTNDLKDGFINVTIDPTDSYIAYKLSLTFGTTILDVAAIALLEAGHSPMLSKSFLQINYQPRELIGKPQALTSLPSQLLMTIFCLQLVTAMFLFYLEKNNNHMERTLVTGVSYLQIIVSHVSVYFCLNLIQTAEMLVIVFAVFQMPLLGSIGLISVMTVLLGFTGMSAGILLAVVADQLLILGTIVIVLLFIAPALSGMVWPIESSSKFYQIFCSCMPFYLPTDGLMDIMYRNLGIFHSNVITAFSVMIVWSLVLMLTSIFWLSKQTS